MIILDDDDDDEFMKCMSNFTRGSGEVVFHSSIALCSLFLTLFPSRVIPSVLLSPALFSAFFLPQTGFILLWWVI